MSAYTEGGFEAVERAGRLFDENVERHLSGVPVQVEIKWVEAPESVWRTYSDEPNAEPYVTIDGKVAEQYYLDTVDTEPMQFTPDDKAVGALSFGDMLAQMWEDTLHYYEVELPALDEQLNELARTTYRDKVIENGTAEGILDLVGMDESELIRIARQLAKADLKAWSDAVEAEQAAQDEAALKQELLTRIANGLLALRDAKATLIQE